VKSMTAGVFWGMTPAKPSKPVKQAVGGLSSAAGM
jgi:hypothetical protein